MDMPDFDNFEDRMPPNSPTLYSPGSREKIEEMIKRLEEGKSVFHPEDADSFPLEWVDQIPKMVIANIIGIRELTSRGKPYGRYRARPYCRRTKTHVNLKSHATKYDAAIAIIMWERQEQERRKNAS